MDKVIAIKAVGDWELDVLAIPYGGPTEKDSQGEYFSQETNLYLDAFKSPLVVYYHGHDPNGRPQGEPEVIGTAVGVEQRGDGVWVRVMLDKLSQYAKRVWEAAKQGIARASSGSISHLVRTASDGRILSWPLAELSLFDTDPSRQPANPYAVALPVMKANYAKSGEELPDLPAEETQAPEAEAIGEEQSAPADAETEEADPIQPENYDGGTKEMDEKDIKELVAEAVKAQKEAQEAEAKAAVEKQAAIDAAVKAEKDKWEAEAAKMGRLPTPTVAKFNKIWKYDHTPTADLALGASILSEQAAKSNKSEGPSDDLLKALAVRSLEGSEESEQAMAYALKSAGMNAVKSDEVMQQDLSSYGDQWVGVGYGTELWRLIRQGTPILDKLPMQEIPQGQETFYDPVEGADPTWYKVAETTDVDSTMKFPVASVTSSQKTTANSSYTLAKAGARVLWSGELDEDSLVPMLPTIRESLVLSGRERLEHVVIDGDTETGASTNVNDIADTPAATDLFLTINGFRKLGLITNTANSRSASGNFTANDFLETVKLMGTAGADALDVTKVGFVIDLNTHWKALELDEVKTKDVFSNPTIENGRLVRIYGYEVIPSAFMHYAQTSRKANTAGKCDLDTAGNNLYGAICAVRWDQWKFGWKRRMTIETERIARSDVTEIVALMRFGLKYRSTEAAAISYYVGV